MSDIYRISELIGRIGISLIFLLSGVNKLGSYAGTQDFMASMGVPGVLLPFVILVEIVGGLALMVGWKTRFIAILLAAFTLSAAILFHADFADKMQMIMFLKNVAIAGGLLVVFAVGAGAFSMDGRKKT